MQRADRIGTRAGEYEITGVLGKGGMGTVYSGVHPVIGTKVAIKVLDPRIADASVVARFVQEARVVNKIRHPNIIEIFAFGESPDLGHYFVMPQLDGMTLADRVNHVGVLTPAVAEPILRQVAAALEAAHEQGIYHRDLKPENVFLISDGRGGDAVKILDFGIAKLNDASSVAVTNDKFSMGTPLYMSPEQWAATGSVDHRTDVYALGVVLHFMLTGRHPFEGSSPVSLMRLHTSQPPALASSHGAPIAADPVIAKALAKDREERHRRAGELHAAFSEAFRAEVSTVPPAAATGPRARQRVVALAATEHAATTGKVRQPRRTMVIAGGALLLGALVVGGLTLWRSNGPASRPNDKRPAAGPPSPSSPTPAAAADAAPPPPATSDAAPPVSRDTGVAGDPKKKPRGRRPAEEPPPRRDVHSTWGSPDDPF
ncbi:MAG TPA: serine/threonine-protein kinase [Kofleriaceae bacterium]